MPSIDKINPGADRACGAGTIDRATRDTALYLYLRETLKSPRLRDMLEKAADEHVGPEESGFARRA